MILRALVSLQRMEDFLDEDEVEDWVSSLKAPHVSPEEAADTKIGFEQASFRWNTGVNVKAEQENKSTEQHDDGNGTTTPPFVFELSDLDVIFPTGKLSVISGPTGAGKSAVLAALLGEMDCISGRSYLPKYPQVVDSETGLKNSVAYASQTPWLQNMSIKLNILFGEPYDEDRYIATVKACALEADFDALDDGDDTEIGSKGLALSGLVQEW
jgi:ABC-type multidrug transport system fused ATPase/permease subunit